jgi:hypothetical protein
MSKKAAAPTARKERGQRRSGSESRGAGMRATMGKEALPRLLIWRLGVEESRCATRLI